MIVTPEGLNVFPEDVERALLAQPGVREAGVVGVRVGGEERIHAVLILDPSATPEKVVRGANATLEDHQRVWSTSLWPGATLPRTEGTQKLKRRELRRAAAGDAAGAPVPAEGASLEAIVGRFAAGRDLGPETTLDELGLSSLDRVEMMMALEDAFQTTIEESALAEAKTIADLRALVMSGGSTGAEILHPSSKRHAIRAEVPVLNRWRLSWFLRRISLPTWIPPWPAFLKLKVEDPEHLRSDGPVIVGIRAMDGRPSDRCPRDGVGLRWRCRASSSTRFHWKADSRG